MLNKQSILAGKGIIICDYREKEIIEMLKKTNFKIIEENLGVGDFILSNSICIERKTYSDFINSILDNRIFEQCKFMKENFEKPILIIELFPYKERNVNEGIIFSTIATLITKMNISIIFTKNIYETFKLIYWIKSKEDAEGFNSPFLVGKKPKEIYKIKKFILSSFPGISEKSSEKLIKEFKSLRKIFNADILKLSKIIGKKRSKKFIEILDNEETDNSGD